MELNEKLLEAHKKVVQLKLSKEVAKTLHGGGASFLYFIVSPVRTCPGLSPCVVCRDRALTESDVLPGREENVAGH